MYSEADIQRAEAAIDKLLSEVPEDPSPKGLLALWKWNRILGQQIEIVMAGILQQGND